MKKDKTDLIYQSNKYTLSRYNFSALQKNIIYYILEALQSKLTQKTLFNDEVVVIPMNKLTVSNNYSYVKKSIRDLRALTIELVEYDEDGDKKDIITGIIHEGELSSGKGIVKLNISKRFIGLVAHAYKEFTAYQLTQAVTLKGVYAKRMYEICHQWKNKGEWTIAIDDFKKILAINKKYNKSTHFKKYVLDPAKKELNQSKDITFTYELLKKTIGKGFEKIKFTIIDLKKNKSTEMETKKLDSNIQIKNRQISEFCNHYYGKHFRIASIIFLIHNLGYRNEIYEVINRVFKDKTITNKGAYVRTIIETKIGKDFEDFRGIQNI